MVFIIVMVLFLLTVLFGLVLYALWLWDNSIIGYGFCNNIEFHFRTYFNKRRLSWVRKDCRMIASRNAQKLYNLLDQEGVDDSDISDEDLGYFPACFRYSRMCRAALHFPAHSVANEKAASDWLQKNFHQDMRASHRLAILPLAIKLTFVRSARECFASDVLDQFDVLKHTV
jgi:hypothetical protein